MHKKKKTNKKKQLKDASYSQYQSKSVVEAAALCQMKIFCVSLYTFPHLAAQDKFVKMKPAEGPAEFKRLKDSIDSLGIWSVCQFSFYMLQQKERQNQYLCVSG